MDTLRKVILYVDSVMYNVKNVKLQVLNVLLAVTLIEIFHKVVPVKRDTVKLGLLKIVSVKIILYLVIFL